MLREAQTGTGGHVIGVDETCGGVLFRAGGLLRPISLPFQSSESEGGCAYLLDDLVNYAIGSARLCSKSQCVLECEKLLVKAILS